MSRKVSDEFTVPLCRVHHRELHRHGNEVLWWKAVGVDPLPVARKLWQHSRLNGSTVATNKVDQDEQAAKAIDPGNNSTAVLEPDRESKDAHNQREGPR